MVSYSSNSSVMGSRSTSASACVCCGGQLSLKDVICRQCSAPGSLSRSASSNTEATSFISVLGASNAGKTVFLGTLLDILSKESGRISGAPASTFSVNLQEHVISALERREFPEKTPSEPDMWNWVHCELSLREKRSTQNLELISPDLAGEAIAYEVQQNGAYPIIQQIVSRSSGVMILCDSIRARAGSSGDDLFAMKLAAYVSQLHGLSPIDAKNREAQASPSLAIVLTKCDACPEAVESPAAFAANNLPRLFEFVRRTFPHHKYFATSVAGNTALTIDPRKGQQHRIPLHIEPRGIVEPLSWLVSQG